MQKASWLPTMAWPMQQCMTVNAAPICWKKPTRSFMQTAHIPAEKLQRIYPMDVKTRSAKRVREIIRWQMNKKNRLKSKVRCRIEHIFGFMTNSMNGITIRSIGITLAWFQIGLTNLVYNICRYEFLKRPQNQGDSCALLKEKGAETARNACLFTIFWDNWLLGRFLLERVVFRGAHK